MEDRVGLSSIHVVEGRRMLGRRRSLHHFFGNDRKFIHSRLHRSVILVDGLLHLCAVRLHRDLRLKQNLELL